MNVVDSRGCLFVSDQQLSQCGGGNFHCYAGVRGQSHTQSLRLFFYEE